MQSMSSGSSNRDSTDDDQRSVDLAFWTQLFVALLHLGLAYDLSCDAQFEEHTRADTHVVLLALPLFFARPLFQGESLRPIFTCQPDRGRSMVASAVAAGRSGTSRTPLPEPQRR
jgi:hypothetical protein